MMCLLEAAASVQFCAATPAKRSLDAVEFVFGPGLLGRDLLVVESGFAIKNGAVEGTHGLGLGIVLDEKALDRHTLKKVVVGDR
jgi:L-alanine-DL-glutamate epimerase-like enolase superfamily enzyme